MWRSGPLPSWPPSGAATLGALVDRLAAALSAERVEAVTRTVDTLRSRADVVPRALAACDGMLSSDRLQRLGHGLVRLLSADRMARLDRALDLAAHGAADRDPGPPHR